MRFDVISLFPEIVEQYCDLSILGRASEQQIITVYTHQLREHGLGNHKQVDDIPYGGGSGMVIRPEPVYQCHDQIPKSPKSKTILLTPRGQTLTQPFIREELSGQDQLIMICGRYEGVDERITELADYQLSLGNYILTGGELGAMIIIDAVTRLLPGVFEAGEREDSFSDLAGQELEAPQYTRPREYRGMSVPEVLLNGHHAEIAKWRQTHQKP